MHAMQKYLHTLAEKARALHQRERRISWESVHLVDELERRKGAAYLGLSSEGLAAFIGLTPNQYWKRAQAARVIQFFPKALTMAQAGETQFSHLAMLAPKITQANADLLLAGIAGKSKRAVEELLSRVTLDGRVLNKDPEVELRLKLTKSQLAKFHRAREVLSHGRHMPTLLDIFTKAIDDLLARRDPTRNAERAAAKNDPAEAPSPRKEVAPELMGKLPSPGKGAMPELMGESLPWGRARSQNI